MSAESTLTALYLHLKENPKYEHSMVELEKPGTARYGLELNKPASVEDTVGFIKECLSQHWPHSIDFASEEMQEPEYADFDEPALELSELKLTGDWRRVTVFEGVESHQHPGASVILFEKEGDKFRVLNWVRDDVKSRA